MYSGQAKSIKKIRRRFFMEILLIILGFIVVTKEAYYRQVETHSYSALKRHVNASWVSGEISNVDQEGNGSALQRKIEQYIDQLRESGHISPDEKTSWLVYDLIHEKELVSVNKDLPMQSASMVKPLVALAFFHKVKKGELEYNDAGKRYLRLMIQWSGNNATNWVMRQVGGPEKVNEILTVNYADIFHQTEIVEYIPPGGTTYKNKSSASDYNRFLCSLWNKTLPYSDEIRRLMSLSSRNRLGDIPPETQVSHKSGSTAQMCGDMAILEIEGKERKHAYTFISIIDRDQSALYYKKWKRSKVNIIKNVSDIVYEYMKDAYNI